MTRRRTPTEMAQARLDVARNRAEAGMRRIARADRELRDAQSALKPLLAAARYAAEHPLLKPEPEPALEVAE